MKILLIESDKLIASNLIHAFKAANHKIVWCKQPQSAIDKADTEAPDAVIMDLLLAERGGIEFLYEFRSYPEWQNIPVIIYSDISPEEFNAATGAYNQLDITAYYYKPATLVSELVSSMESVMRPLSS